MAQLPDFLNKLYKTKGSSGYGGGSGNTWYGQGTQRADGSVYSASGQQIQGPTLHHGFGPPKKPSKKTGMGGQSHGSVAQKMANSMMKQSRQNQATNLADISSTQAQATSALSNMNAQQAAIAASTQQQTMDASQQGLSDQQRQIALNLANQQKAAAQYGTAYGNLLGSMRGSTEQRLDRLQPQVEQAASQGQMASEEAARAGYGRYSELALQREQFMRDDVALTEQRRTESLNEYKNALSQYEQDRGTALNAALDKRLEGARQYGLSEKENIQRALLEHNAGVMVAGAANGFSTSLNAQKQEGLMKSLQSTADVNFKKQQLMDAATNDWTTGTLQTADSVLAGRKNVSDVLDGILTASGKSREAIGSATSTALVAAVTGFNEAVLAATNTRSKQVVDFVKDKILKVNEAEQTIDTAQISALQLLGNLDMKLIETASKDQLDALTKNTDRIGEAIKNKGTMDMERIKTYYTSHVEILTKMAELRTGVRDAGLKGVMDGYGKKFDTLDSIMNKKHEREMQVLSAAGR